MKQAQRSDDFGDLDREWHCMIVDCFESCSDEQLAQWFDVLPADLRSARDSLKASR